MSVGLGVSQRAHVNARKGRVASGYAQVKVTAVCRLQLCVVPHFHDFTKDRREPKVRPAGAMIPVLMGLAGIRSGDEGRSVAMAEFGPGACRS